MAYSELPSSLALSKFHEFFHRDVSDELVKFIGQEKSINLNIMEEHIRFQHQGTRNKRATLQFLILVLTGVLFLAGCTGEGYITQEHTGEEEYLSIRLDLSADEPVVFKANEEKGSIYYKTEEGIRWLKEESRFRKGKDNQYTGIWNVDERVIEISFRKGNDRLYFDFTADPDQDIEGWGIYLAAKEDEYFSGLIERTVDGHQSKSWDEDIQTGLNLRGHKVEMMVQPTMGLNAPFYVSSEGYGLFIKGTWPGVYDLCKSDPERVHIVFEGPELSGIIYTADHPGKIIRNHALDAGPSILPPKWVFRPIRWRDDHSNRDTYYDGTPAPDVFNSMVTEDILMMEAFDIPCGAYWIDRPWARGPIGYDDFEWDPERFPNAGKMLDWLHGKGIKPLLWIAPWVSGDMADTARKRGYHIPFTETGEDGHQRYGAENDLALIDFTNQEAVEWWQQEGLAPLLEQGIKGFKMDRSEELVPYRGEYVYENGKTAREMRNAYPVYYAKAAHDIASEVHGNDFVLFPRAGYTHSSRYAIFWGGDIASPPRGLRAAIIASQRAAVMGYPIWGSDIGGYWQGAMDHEVTARWLAFGCFNPLMEVGPTENRGLWDVRYTPSYDTTLIAVWRLYATLHDRLSDYTYKLAEEAHQEGTPVMRPLFMVFPGQEKAWEQWQSFMYGPDILVSAIWQKEVDTKSVYLPEGQRWRDAWDPGTVYEGGTSVEINTPVYKIPFFIKEESSLEIGNLQALYEESLQRAAKRPDLKELASEISGAE